MPLERWFRPRKTSGEARHHARGLPILPFAMLVGPRSSRGHIDDKDAGQIGAVRSTRLSRMRGPGGLDLRSSGPFFIRLMNIGGPIGRGQCGTLSVKDVRARSRETEGRLGRAPGRGGRVTEKSA